MRVLPGFRVNDEKDARGYLQALAKKMTEELDSVKQANSSVSFKTFFLCLFTSLLCFTFFTIGGAWYLFSTLLPCHSSGSFLLQKETRMLCLFPLTLTQARDWQMRKSVRQNKQEILTLQASLQTEVQAKELLDAEVTKLKAQLDANEQ